MGKITFQYKIFASVCKYICSISRNNDSSPPSYPCFTATTCQINDFPSFFQCILHYPSHGRTKYAWLYINIIIHKWKHRIMRVDIMVIKYVELIQVEVILNMRCHFGKMWACFEDAEKCVVAKVVRFPKATIIESSRPRKCFCFQLHQIK